MMLVCCVLYTDGLTLKPLFSLTGRVNDNALLIIKNQYRLALRLVSCCDVINPISRRSISNDGLTYLVKKNGFPA